MKKIAVIKTCGDCPNFDNEHWGYKELCRPIPVNGNCEYPIPKDCPLENTNAIEKLIKEWLDKAGSIMPDSCEYSISRGVWRECAGKLKQLIEKKEE